MANDGQAEEGSVSGGGRQPAAGGGCPTALPASDPPLSRRSVAAVFAGLLVAMTVGTLNQTIVATVLPTIVGELGGVNRMLWVTTSYVLAATVTMPLYGKMGDLIGRKGLFIGALALFVAGSAACALAPSMEGLVIGRAVQGLGGGGLMVLSQAIVADVVPPRRRALYLSIMGVAYAVPMLAGPLLGGFFADAVGWRWAFWFDVPLALAAIVIAAAFLPKPRRTAERAPFDVGGAVTLVAAVTALTLATLWGGNEHAWTSPTIIGLLVATAVASALFVLAERRAREPLMALSLFKNRNFDISIVASSITMFVMIGVLTYLPTYFQIVDDLNATAAGYLVAPMNAAWFAASLLSGYLVNKLGTYKKLMVVSFAVLVAGMVGFIAVDQDPSAVVVGGLLAVMGFGVGLNFEILVLVVQNEFPASAVGMATAATGFFRKVGSVLGTSVVGALFTSGLARALAERLAPVGGVGALGTDANSLTPAIVHALPPDVRHAVGAAYSDALAPVLWLALPLAVAGLVLMLFLRETRLATTVDGSGHGADEGADDPRRRQGARRR